MRLSALFFFLLLASFAFADKKNPIDAKQVEAATALIDQHLATGWKEANIEPPQAVDDAAYYRRIWLDIAGRIPPAADVRAFIADKSPNKRAHAVAELLDGPNYLYHFSHVWRSIWLPEAENDFQLRYISLEFEAWLRKKLAADAGFDEIVRDIITTPVAAPRGQGVFAYYSSQREPRPIAFFAAKEVKPENLAAATARAFLGQRVECAQCHDHPSGDWKRDQFWGFAAFFSGIERGEDGGLADRLAGLFTGQTSAELDIEIPDTDRRVSAQFLDKTSPTAKQLVRPRDALAAWLVTDNPQFAKAAVNRIWEHMLGSGLVDPVDDFGNSNPASHPQLLDELATRFAKSGYNIKFLLRAIAASRAYQAPSASEQASENDVLLFAIFQTKALTAKQLYDSLSQASGLPRESYLNAQSFSFQQSSNQEEIRQLFGDASAPVSQRPVSVLQALSMMNSKLIAEATDVKNGRTLSAIAEMPLMNTTGRIESLYFTALGRPPTAGELKRLTAYVERNSSEDGQRQALGDIYWALLNSTAFLTNH